MKVEIQNRRIGLLNRCSKVINVTAFKLLVFILSIMAGVNNSVWSQTNFSLYNNTPLQVNPSLLSHDDYARLIFNYRNQRIGEDVNFQTSLFSLMVPLVNGRNNHRWGGVGVSFLDDRTDDDSFLSNQRINLSFAYNLQLSAIHNISFGAQGAWFSREISTQGLTTGSQWVRNVGFDVSAPLGEDALATRVSAQSFGTGASWYMTNSDNERIAHFGISAFDINEPVNSFFDSDASLPMTVTIHGAFRIIDNVKWSLTPEFLAQRQLGTNFINVGATASYKFKNDDPFHPITSGSLDLSARFLKDQGIGMGIQFVQRNFEVGVNYTVPTESRDVDPIRNAFEFHIILKRKVNRKKVPVKTVNNYDVGQVREFYENDNTLDESAEFKEESQKSKTGESTNTSTGTGLSGNFRFELRKDFKFDFNDATIKEESKPYLNDMAKILKENKLLKLEIVGHADNVGTDEVNLKLSQQRADAVFDYLVKESGIQRLRLKATGRGASEPLVENNTVKNRARNRRVEFIIYQD